MHVPQAAKLQNHEEGNQNNLKVFFVQIIPPCFCLGVTINMSELMCFQSLTSFQISFLFYQARSPRKSTRLWDTQISLREQVQQEFLNYLRFEDCLKFSAEKLCL